MLTNNIDLSTLTNEEQRSNWTPIGSDSSHAYYGTFDGCGYTISNLSVDGELVYAGLFGYSSSTAGTVKNLNVSGKITNKTTTGNESYSGGIVACISGSTVTNCSFDGEINGTLRVGGIVGFMDGGVVSNCYTSGEVTGNLLGNECSTGGIAGYCFDGTVENCTNAAIVKGESNSGGIIGYSNYGTVSSCFNYGNVESGENIGGIAGSNSSSTVSNCIWLADTAEKGIGSGNDNGATGIDDISSVVTWLSLSQSAVEVEINKAVEIDLILKPAMSASGGTAPDGAFGDAGAVRADEVGPLSISDGNIASAEYAGGKITVTGKSIGETTLTMQVKLHPTDFSSLTNETPEYENDDTIDFTFSLPVRVVAEAQNGGSSSGSGSSGGGGGGCSAGFGALTLLAAVPLLFRRKK